MCQSDPVTLRRTAEALMDPNDRLKKVGGGKRAVETVG